MGCLVQDSGSCGGQVGTTPLGKGCVSTAVREKERNFHEGMLARFSAARTVANQQITEANSTNFTPLNYYFKSKLNMLKQIDETFRVEYGLVQCLGSGPGQQKLQNDILAKLPDETHAVLISQARVDVERIHNSPIYKYGSTTAQAAVDEVLSQLHMLENGGEPQFKHWDQDEFLTAVMGRFKFFVRTQGGGGATLIGEEALHHIMKDLRAKFDNNVKVGLGDGPLPVLIVGGEEKRAGGVVR